MLGQHLFDNMFLRPITCWSDTQFYLPQLGHGEVNNLLCFFASGFRWVDFVYSREDRISKSQGPPYIIAMLVNLGYTAAIVVFMQPRSSGSSLALLAKQLATVIHYVLKPT